MKTYRHKTSPIKAIHFNGNNFTACREFVGDDCDNSMNFPNIREYLTGDIIRINSGDWITRNENNGLRSFSDREFKENYEEDSSERIINE